MYMTSPQHNFQHYIKRAGGGLMSTIYFNQDNCVPIVIFVKAITFLLTPSSPIAFNSSFLSVEMYKQHAHDYALSVVSFLKLF